jgi:hypothetical protein
MKITPLAAVVGGLLAGAAGTASMDTVRYLRYRRGGGTERPLAWEFAPVASWEEAPAPGQVAKRLLEGFTQRALPDRWAWLVSNSAHWTYGAAWGALYGVVAGSARRPHPLRGLSLGAVVWGTGYLVLPRAGLYEPVWKYDAKTLTSDLTAHLVYGVGTGAFFCLFTGLRRAGLRAARS